MKIGILTQPLHNNYGGTLQNFAMQTLLRQLGHEPVTLTYSNISPKDLFLIYRAYIYRTLIFSPIRRQIKLPYRKNIDERHFRRFEQLHIVKHRVGKGYISDIKVKKLNLDAIVVGSDQVWRPIYNRGAILGNMFLDFAEEDNNIKKIAYGASFGTDNINEFTHEQVFRASQLLKKFDAISVRETSGVDICRKYFGTDAVHVLDPTLMINRETYDGLTHQPRETKYIAVYILDQNESKRNFVENISRKYDLTPIYIGNRGKKGKWPSIESWLSYIRYADYVITDSFHGSIFSLIYQKPFITIINNQRGNSRFQSLKDTIINEEIFLDESNLDANISTFPNFNWQQISARMNELKESSKNFLLNALSM